MIKKYIPNTITCLNLFSGAVAVYLAFKGELQGAFIAVLLSAVFDFLDGLAARLLKAYSPMGKELDSLADVISFGMAPGAIVFSFLSGMNVAWWLPFAGFLIPVFSGLRLAKFNIDTRQAESFIGLPVPANAIFWGGLITAFSAFLAGNLWITFILIGLFCFLLISEIPMFSLKFKSLGWKQNKLQYLFLLVNVLLLAIFRLDAFAPIIAWYISLSIAVVVLKK